MRWAIPRSMQLDGFFWNRIYPLHANTWPSFFKRLSPMLWYISKLLECPALILSFKAIAYQKQDDHLLNSMAKELHLPNPATFGDTHSKRFLTLPGRGRFRTGFSLRVPSKNPSELAKSGSSEARITLFVSFPHFGKSSSNIPLDPESESVELLDFKRPETDAPNPSPVMSEGDKDDIEEILVHQARYMIFDNCKLCFSAYCWSKYRC